MHRCTFCRVSRRTNSFCSPMPYSYGRPIVFRYIGAQLDMGLVGYWSTGWPGSQLGQLFGGFGLSLVDQHRPTYKSDRNTNLIISRSSSIAGNFHIRAPVLVTMSTNNWMYFLTYSLAGADQGIREREEGTSRFLPLPLPSTFLLFRLSSFLYIEAGPMKPSAGSGEAL